MPRVEPEAASTTASSVAARRGRERLRPDAGTRGALFSAASKIIRERGVHALTVADVLARAKLGTRAFYRHFDSKDQLVQAVFLEMARVEMRRLRRKMAAASNPVAAVAAWIDGRLDLAFDETVRSDLRVLSLEAQSQMFAAPAVVSPAYREMLTPLIDQLELGQRQGIFTKTDPLTHAELLHGAIWACVERQWATGDCDHAKAREAALRFCLGGLGAPEHLIASVFGHG
ncbi:TetR/AcrR family transcriptional regulator [Mycobacterium malmoense]|uniref:TetR/AcrR family transcriptional regulator n=1 Tax=Mycobacterium malmoense TaxID=1780 RepID=UPI0008F8ACD2|nr:TetR/AcrR family transcriptional regulator [Mycobacterium malmoense]OIN81321.1 TetR family transcriptional regulator [Mycobacterium malmoense]